MDDIVKWLRSPKPWHKYTPAEIADEIERRNALLACAYQLAGYYDAPIRFLNAFALFDEYAKMSPDQIMDALLPITDQPSAGLEPCACDHGSFGNYPCQSDSASPYDAARYYCKKSGLPVGTPNQPQEQRMSEREAFEEWCRLNCSPRAESSDWYWRIFQAGAAWQRSTAHQPSAGPCEICGGHKIVTDDGKTYRPCPDCTTVKGTAP